MPHASVDGIKLYYEEAGTGAPLVFVHEFAGDARSWHLQMRFFARRYRCIAFNARGYPPSDVPDDPVRTPSSAPSTTSRACSTTWASPRRTCAGCRWAATPRCSSASSIPERALSLVVAGCGYGSVITDREAFKKDSDLVARRFEADGMAKVADFYSRGPTRVQFIDKDPQGWQEFHDQFAAGSARGHALTLRGVQMTRPSVFELGERWSASRRPTLVMTGDEDEPCLEPNVFMKRKIPRPDSSSSPRRATPSTSRTPRPSTAPSSTSSPPSTPAAGRAAIPPRSPSRRSCRPPSGGSARVARFPPRARRRAARRGPGVGPLTTADAVPVTRGAVPTPWPLCRRLAGGKGSADPPPGPRPATRPVTVCAFANDTRLGGINFHTSRRAQ